MDTYKNSLGLPGLPDAGFCEELSPRDSWCVAERKNTSLNFYNFIIV